jgi:hypothetical protein
MMMYVQTRQNRVAKIAKELSDMIIYVQVRQNIHHLYTTGLQITQQQNLSGHHWIMSFLVFRKQCLVAKPTLQDGWFEFVKSRFV